MGANQFLTGNNTMTDQENACAAVVHRWFEEVWNKGRIEAIEEMLDPGCVVNGINDAGGNPVQGPAGFKPFFQNFRNSFPDIKITIEDTLVMGDKVAVRCRVKGTHVGDGLGFPATQKPIEVTGIAIARVENQKIVGAWNNFDFLGLYQQMGVLSLSAPPELLD